MAFNNPSTPWKEMEKCLSGRTPNENPPQWATGGDGPAWSRKRAPYSPPMDLMVGRRESHFPYAELHCHTNFSFLSGASHPEELVEEALRLGLDALAVTDLNGLYGVVRFAEAARQVSMPTVFGVELTLDGPLDPPVGDPDPPGERIVILARNPNGYASLARAISQAQLGGKKGAPQATLETLAGQTSEYGEGNWAVLTGGSKGPLTKALYQEGPAAAGRALDQLVDAFGRDHVHVELWDHGDPLDSSRNDALSQMAIKRNVGVVATNNVHYATPGRGRLATALAAVRARRSLSEMDPWLPGGQGAYLRSGAEQHRRFSRYPGVVHAAGELAGNCVFDLRLVAPKLPPFPCPDGLSEMDFLRRLVTKGASRRERYGPEPTDLSGPSFAQRAWRQIHHELAVIEALGFAGYFLIVWDIVEFCRRSDIYCQGRGSAANSAACWALGITKADAVRLGLLFERFLSPERDGPPDIDLDIESGRREEVIQYVYDRYGRHNAAQVANVITYRARSAVRDMAKALGADPGQQDAWSKQLDPWKGISGTAQLTDQQIPANVLELAGEVEHFPRHLGIHSGGMVLCDRPVIEVCPVEWASMADRSVLQWDKDDCAAVGLVKFDLLGLGMLSALHRMVDLVREHTDPDVDLATIPQDDSVYEMLCQADSIGVFQVESRAQMATLPRLKPRTFYDLVVEVALIRPGPIQGGSVHPYIRRRNGKEPVTYAHPLLEPALRKTLGIPLFQEQLMQMAIDVAGFTPSEADQLRQAMGSKRSTEKMERLKARLYEGMAERGITGEIADDIYVKLAAFANYGFPESHSVSFAYLVYASAWFKRHHPAAFCAGLLDSQPMGFYSPHSLVQDARRHGVEVLSPCVAASEGGARLQRCDPKRSTGGLALRLGLSTVRGIGKELADTIAAGRPYRDTEDLARRVRLSVAQLEALATAGALAAFETDPEQARGPGDGRRRALWSVGAVAQGSDKQLEGIVTGTSVPTLPGMSEWEIAAADMWSTGISVNGHPTRLAREELDRLGVVVASELKSQTPGKRVLVGGVVTHRQRPATAGGTTFMSLEDETGMANIVISQGCWTRYRRLAQSAPALLVRGRVEMAEGVVNVIAEKISVLKIHAPMRSRDFR